MQTRDFSSIATEPFGWGESIFLLEVTKVTKAPHIHDDVFVISKREIFLRRTEPRGIRIFIMVCGASSPRVEFGDGLDSPAHSEDIGEYHLISDRVLMGHSTSSLSASCITLLFQGVD